VSAIDDVEDGTQGETVIDPDLATDPSSPEVTSGDTPDPRAAEAPDADPDSRPAESDADTREGVE
jgi:hypothetical protein